MMKPEPPPIVQSSTPSSTPACAAAAGRAERARAAAVDRSKILIIVLSASRRVGGFQPAKRAIVSGSRSKSRRAAGLALTTISAGARAGKPFDGRLVVGIERLGARI